MRKIYAFLGAVLTTVGTLVFTGSNAQVFLQESFDNFSLPTGWTMSGTGNSGWEFSGVLGYNMSGTTDHTGNGGSFAWQDGSAPYPFNAWLQSPSVTISAGSVLEFYMKRSDNTALTQHNTFHVQVDDGTGFINVFTHTSPTANQDWELFSVPLTGYSGSISIRFLNLKNGQPFAFYDDIAIDDILVFTIPDPSGATASATTVCSGAQVTLTAQGITGSAEWFTGSCGGTSIGTGTSITVNPTANTTYYVANIVNGSPSANCASVAITAQPSGLTSTPTILDAACDASAIGYTGDGEISITTTVAAGGAATPGGPYNYTWSTSATSSGTTSSITGLVEGTYDVTITDPATNCQVFESYSVSDPGPLSTASSTTDVICNGQSNGTATLFISTGATAPYNFVWPSGLAGTLPANSDTTDTALAAGIYVVTITDDTGCVYEQSITVDEPAPLAYSSVITDANCHEDNVGTFGFIDATITGGNAPYTYVWSNGDSTQDLTNVVAGVYNVTVTDDKGCTFTPANPDTISGPNNPINTIVDSIFNPLCFGDVTGYAQISGTGGTQFTTTVSDTIGTAGLVTTTVDETPFGTEHADNKNQFVYTAQELAAAGFQAGEVAKLGFEVVSASPDTMNSFKIRMGTAGGCGDYTLELYDSFGDGWNGNTITYEVDGVSTTINGFTTGTFFDETFTVCTNSQITLTYNAGGGFQNEVSYALFDDQGNQLFSAGPFPPIGVPFTYTVPPFPFAGFNGDWFNTNMTTVYSGDHVATPGWNIFNTSGYVWDGTSDIIIQTCFDNGGSTSGLSSHVTAENTGMDYTAYGSSMTSTYANPCNNEPYDGVTQIRPLLYFAMQENPSQYVYNWASSSGPADSTLTDLAAGDYVVTLTDNNNCADVDTITITEPAELLLSPSATDVLCNGDQTGMLMANENGGTSPYTINWDNGSTGSSVSNVGAGMYHVTITDDNGCVATGMTEVNEPSELVAAISETEDVVCEGDAEGMAMVAADGGTPGYTYTWSNGQTGTTIDGLTEGTYNVTITDANGCDVTTSATINAANALPNVNLGPDQQVGSGTVVTLDATTSFINYLWNDDPNFINTTFTFLATQDTTIYVEVLDANGCTNVDTVMISVATGLNGINNDLGVTYYPNPTEGMVNFEFDGIDGQQVNVEIVNIQGQRVSFQQFNQVVSGTAYQLDLTNEAKGVYFVKLSSGSHSSVHKLTIR